MPGCNTLIVTEHHKLGYNYHVLVISNSGLSKNTYHKLFGEFFPEFKDKMDVRGVKSVLTSLNSIFKSLPLKDLILFIGGGSPKCLSSRNTRFWIEEIKKLKGSDIKTALIALSMYKCDSLEQWRVENISNMHIFAHKSASISHIWTMVQSLKPCKSVLSPYLEIIEKSQKYDSNLYEFGDFLAILHKYGLNSQHLRAITHTLYGLLLREKYYPLLTKSKRLILVGNPNTGKTRIITSLGEFFDPSIFYHVGTRKDDFSRYNRSDKPLIVWDDVFEVKSNRVWSKHALLKLLAHETIKVDVKYGYPVEVKSAYNIILTNDANLFKNEANLQARLKLISLPADSIGEWANITQEEIQILVLTLLSDLILTLNYPRIINDMNYGK